MSVALEDLKGVAEVQLSLNDGSARIVLEPGNTVTLADIRTVVQERGFMPRESRVTARGTLTVSTAGAATFEVLGTGEVFDARGGAVSAVDWYADRVVTVEGLVPAPDDNTPDRIAIDKIRQEGVAARGRGAVAAAGSTPRLGPPAWQG